MTKIIAAKLGDENEYRVNTGVAAPRVGDTASREEGAAKQALGSFGSVAIRADQALDAGANRSQQKGRQMRVIGRLRFDLALGATRLGTADRGHARGWRGGRRHECLGGG